MGEMMAVARRMGPSGALPGAGRGCWALPPPVRPPGAEPKPSTELDDAGGPAVAEVDADEVADGADAPAAPPAEPGPEEDDDGVGDAGALGSTGGTVPSCAATALAAACV